MDKDLLLQQARSYIDLSMGGLESENRKIEFKERWYDLTDLSGINEFLKDASAMANTFGPDGMIIVGYNDKTKSQTSATFKDSRLPDTSRIIDLINKRVDRLFEVDIIEIEINGIPTSIIHIPPSIDKPHVIRNYQTKDSKGEIRNEANKIF